MGHGDAAAHHAAQHRSEASELTRLDAAEAAQLTAARELTEERARVADERTRRSVDLRLNEEKVQRQAEAMAREVSRARAEAMAEAGAKLDAIVNEITTADQLAKQSQQEAEHMRLIQEERLSPSRLSPLRLSPSSAQVESTSNEIMTKVDMALAAAKARRQTEEQMYAAGARQREAATALAIEPAFQRQATESAEELRRLSTPTSPPVLSPYASVPTSSPWQAKVEQNLKKHADVDAETALLLSERAHSAAREARRMSTEARLISEAAEARLKAESAEARLSAERAVSTWARLETDLRQGQKPFPHLDLATTDLSPGAAYSAHLANRMTDRLQATAVPTAVREAEIALARAKQVRDRAV